MKTKSKIIVLSLLICSTALADFPAWMTNWTSINGRHWITDIGYDLPTLTPVEGDNMYISPQLDIVYAKNFPWVYSKVYGWLFVQGNYGENTVAYLLERFESGYGFNRKSELTPNSLEPGWYYFGKIFLRIIPQEEIPGRWIQEITSLGENEIYEINLGWLYNDIEYQE